MNNKLWPLAVMFTALMCCLAVVGRPAPVQAAASTTSSATNSVEATLNCATTITKIPCGVGTKSVHVRVTGANNVAFGGSAVTYATSPVIRSTDAEYSANREYTWCIATTGTSAITYSCLR